jgi:deoxyribodipyrimidine photolyase-related protein
MRHLILVLGDQLNFDSPALENFDPARDSLLMIEAPGEASYVWSHKARIALFLSSMRHFINQAAARNWPFDYIQIDEQLPPTFEERLTLALRRHSPDALVVVEPGEWRMQKAIESVCAAEGVALRLLDDTHFLSSRHEFSQWAKGKKELRLEFFYRVMRKRYNVLMADAEPEGGQWNFDTDNRSAYPKRTGPGEIAEPAFFEPDEITKEVFYLVEKLFPDHPGQLEKFAWPVTRDQALHALEVFVASRLPSFGQYQDAMWTNTPLGWHSLLSAALNLHLINPREVIAAVETAYRDGRVSLASAEGFIRQVLGWREFIRGVYWTDMPKLKEANHYQSKGDLPAWFWTGETRMACMRDSLQQTMEWGYAHHIQRLMVIGNFATLAQLSPQQVGDWFLAIYVDAIEWVELPNTAGMALHACGSRFTSKPYVASGAYIGRQSNYCGQCHYDATKRSGEKACPYNTLYWDFIDRHEASLSSNPRTALMTKNLQKMDVDERARVKLHAKQILGNLDIL